MDDEGECEAVGDTEGGGGRLCAAWEKWPTSECTT